jgi:hypothetical protein
MRNFEQPYLSKNISDFWRRWHISLSTWFRDYLYIPLGGNRKGIFLTYRNLIVTMLVCGLWHGANWTFVAWGGLHGIYLMIHRAIIKSKKTFERTDFLIKQSLSFYKVVVTFHLVAFGWILFRCDSFTHFINFVHGIISFQEGTGVIPPLSLFSPKLILPILILLFIDILQKKTGKHAVILDKNWMFRGMAYAGIISIIFLIGGIDVQVPFIYFQF